MKCNAAKEEWINQQCQEIEQKLNIDSKFMHAKIKDVSGKKIKCSSPGCIKSKDGTMLMEKKEILNKWSEYVEDRFKDDRCKKPKIKKNIEGSTIHKEEEQPLILPPGPAQQQTEADHNNTSSQNPLWEFGTPLLEPNFHFARLRKHGIYFVHWRDGKNCRDVFVTLFLLLLAWFPDGLINLMVL
ncbi:hypothetical protein PoB_007555900 [Plakobranchus ocellatus]|uniref:Uncharacterized protein n=1 Tax=Plakobranchus ocellatus TaxID=259542 RepID=A0AAV4DYB1_9GAST|nr:hypothetical protein PoB_007555900 [Plakobranchus ocellatus]